MSWTDDGRVSTPPSSVVYAAAGVLLVVALAGVGFGLQTGWRDTGRPEAGSVDDQLSPGQATAAQPIVDIQSAEQQPPAAAPSNAVAADSEEADSNDIAAKTAAAQAVQSKTSQSPQNIDDILTSSSEKPQAPAKPSTDEDAPNTGKTDVPF
ncbi:MAG TPA: hypothetical protein VGL58_04280 [Caulobacteraceae bacterium]|jgi:hypothetical protein